MPSKKTPKGAAPTVGIDIPRFGPKPNTKPILVGRPHWEHGPDSIPLPGAPTQRAAAAPKARKTGAKGRRAPIAPAPVAVSAPTPTTK